MNDAAASYERQCEGLGAEFLASLETVLRRVEADPDLHPEVDPDVRRCLTARFPYAVTDMIVGADLVVIAIAHRHRRPRCWGSRV